MSSLWLFILLLSEIVLLCSEALMDTPGMCPRQDRPLNGGRQRGGLVKQEALAGPSASPQPTCTAQVDVPKAQTLCPEMPTWGRALGSPAPASGCLLTDIISLQSESRRDPSTCTMALQGG